MRTGKLLLAALLSVAFAAESARAYQGREVSVFFFGGSVSLPVCSTGTFTAASVPIPLKYNSKKNYLTITTQIESYCPGAQVYASVSIAGNDVPPRVYVKQCDGSFSASTTGLWYALPESEGGPAVPDGSTVDVRLCQNASGGTFESVQVKVEVQK